MVEGAVGTPLGHDSGSKHVSGEATYIDDIPEPPGTLHIYIAMSERAHAVASGRSMYRRCGARPAWPSC